MLVSTWDSFQIAPFSTQIMLVEKKYCPIDVYSTLAIHRNWMGVNGDGDGASTFSSHQYPNTRASSFKNLWCSQEHMICLWLLEMSCGFESRQALRVASVQHSSNTLSNNRANLLFFFGLSTSRSKSSKTLLSLRGNLFYSERCRTQPSKNIQCHRWLVQQHTSYDD